MCCLPNKFPLPVFLLLNKCDLIETDKRRDWTGKVEEYTNENQFCNYYYVSALNNKDNKDHKEKIDKTGI